MMISRLCELPSVGENTVRETLRRACWESGDWASAVEFAGHTGSPSEASNTRLFLSNTVHRRPAKPTWISEAP